VAMNAAPMARHSRSPTPAKGKKGDKRGSGTAPSRKITLLPHPPFTNSKTLAMACVSITVSMGQGLKSVWTLAPIQKTNKSPSLGGCNNNTCHCHSFPSNSGLIFMTDEMTNDKYLVDSGTPSSIVPHKSISKPSGPLLRGANGLPIPSWGFITKAIQFQ
jgi:hypothetical protein